VINFTPCPLYLQGKSLWYPFDRRLGGPQSHSGQSGEEKNSHLENMKTEVSLSL